MSFAAPLVLLALLAVPVLVRLYLGHNRRRTRAAAAFVTTPLAPSVAPHRPRWRRHVPMLAFGIALTALIVAAARPQQSSAVPVTDGAVMLANDASSSMAATDVSPSRLRAAFQADEHFLANVPSAIRVGLLEFARRPRLLQTPTSDHSLTRAALTPPNLTGGTAIGDSINLAVHTLTSLHAQNGKHLPSAIVLLSDGASNVGASPLAAARQAKAQHIPIYTVSLGTPQGTINIKRGSATAKVPVPVSPQELTQIASLSGGKAFSAADTSHLTEVYAHLAAQLGRKHVKHEITAAFAGGGLVLLLLGSALSLGWFGRLI